jgi:hypothetical protein
MFWEVIVPFDSSHGFTFQLYAISPVTPHFRLQQATINPNFSSSFLRGTTQLISHPSTLLNSLSVKSKPHRLAWAMAL